MSQSFESIIEERAGCPAYGCHVTLEYSALDNRATATLNHEGVRGEFALGWSGATERVVDWLRGHHSAGHPLGMDDASYAEAFDYAVDRSGRLWRMAHR